MTINNALGRVLQLRGVNYLWRQEDFPQKNFEPDLQMGLIAQEVEQWVPEVVRTDSAGFKAVEYSKLVALLIEAMKEQQKKINSQDAAILQMQMQLGVFKAELDRMKQDEIGIVDVSKGKK